MNVHSLLRKASVVPKRDQILDAALSLFAERGYSAAPVPEIAARAGVAAGTIYRYFDGKEALVNELFRRHKTEFLKTLTKDFPVGTPPRVQFHHLWTAMNAFAAANPVAFAFCEHHYHLPYLDEASRSLDAAVRDFARRFVEQAAASGVLKKEAPDLLIAVVFGIFVNVLRQVPDQGQSALAQAENCAWDAIASR